MRLVHWLSLTALVVGLVLFVMGLPTAGSVVLVLATSMELLHSALTGKQTNDGTR